MAFWRPPGLSPRKEAVLAADLLLLSLLLLQRLMPSSGQYQQQPSAEEAPPENGITEEPLVQCGVDSLSMEIRTLQPFSGRLFVKGFSQERQCQLVGNGSHTQLQLAVHFGHCGLRRSREINGVSVQTTVVVSFHPIFITKLDRAYRLNCFYTEARKAVSQQLEVGQLTTSGAIHRQGPMPVCRYDILWLNAQGQPIRFARIGDTVFHRWSCQSEEADTYCMRVHSCTVSDGQGGQAVEVLDRLGCGVDALLLRDLDYTGDLSAGQTASVFKFADKPTLHFNCQIELTLRDPLQDCQLSRPKCSAIARPFTGKSGQPTAARPPSTASATVGPVYDQPTGKTGRTPSSSSTSRASGNTRGTQTPPTAPTPTSLPTAPTTAPTALVQETALPSAQFRVLTNRSTLGDQLVPFTAPPPPSAGTGAYGPRQTQVPPSKLVTEGRTTEGSAETGAEETPVGDWAQQDAIYQDETNSATRRRTPPPRSQRGDAEKRVVRKVADFDLPERSLVVIELDENSLAHQPLIWRLLNSSLASAGGLQCPPPSLAAQVPHWTILLVMLFVLILVSALLWTNWPSKSELLIGEAAAKLTADRQQRSRWNVGTTGSAAAAVGRGEEAEEDQHFAHQHLQGPSLRF